MSTPVCSEYLRGYFAGWSDAKHGRGYGASARPPAGTCDCDSCQRWARLVDAAGNPFVPQVRQVTEPEAKSIHLTPLPEPEADR